MGGYGYETQASIKYLETPLISTVNWLRYTVLKPDQSRVHFEDPSAILKKGTFWCLSGKFKR